jgi:hypothetical protein
MTTHSSYCHTGKIIAFEVERRLGFSVRWDGNVLHLLEPVDHVKLECIANSTFVPVTDGCVKSQQNQFAQDHSPLQDDYTHLRDEVIMLRLAQNWEREKLLEILKHQTLVHKGLLDMVRTLAPLTDAGVREELVKMHGAIIQNLKALHYMRPCT